MTTTSDQRENVSNNSLQCIFLGDMGVIRVQGDDAADFLHKQLTQDFLLLADGQARLAAYCNIKGRMIASFIGLKLSKNDILLIACADILAVTIKKLRMYVLRAKVTISDASEDYTVAGILGAAPEFSDPMLPWQKESCTSKTLDLLATSTGFTGFSATFGQIISLPPAGTTPRAIVVSERSLNPHKQAQPSQVNNLHLWHLHEILSGLAMVRLPISEVFLPQMLNYDLLGGVNFQKGCYPGQEVVARSQYRGTLKRRTFLAYTDKQNADLTQKNALEQSDLADCEIFETGPNAIPPEEASKADFEDSNGGNSCGSVVQSAPQYFATPQASYSYALLVCVNIATAQTQKLALLYNQRSLPLQDVAFLHKFAQKQ